MAEERRVEMVRLVGEERVYDREVLLGRDTSSVFPSLARQQQEEEGVGGLSVEAIKEALGARKFISESELDTLRATRGVTADDGAVAVDKPLAEILRERKAAKDAEHAEKWRLMKVGKNRPLEADELEFLDSVAATEAAREREWSERERAELEAFKAAVRGRSAEPEGPPGGEAAEGRSRPAVHKADPRVPSVVASAAAGGPSLGPVKGPAALLRPVVRVKPKAASNAAGGSAAAAASAADKREASTSAASTSSAAATSLPGTGAKAGSAGAASTEEPPTKRTKVLTEDAGTAATGTGDWERGKAGEGNGGGQGRESEGGGGGGSGGGGGGLSGLIGDYGSGSESDG